MRRFSVNCSSTRNRCAAFRATVGMVLTLLAALTVQGFGFAAEPLQVATMPLNPAQAIRDLAAAYAEDTGEPATVTVCGSFDELASGLRSGRFDVVLGTCANSAEALVERGLVRPDTRRALYYHRMAIMLPPGNPARILSAADVDRAGLRIGLFDIHMHGPLVERVKPEATIVCRDQRLLLDMLERGELDAVLTWDCFGGVRPDLATMRLPRRVAGEEAAMPAPCFIGANTERVMEANLFLDFCTDSPKARDTLLSHALVLWDGADERYQGADHKFMPVYRYVARQIVQDYAAGRKSCLDLGCGEGQMTVEIAGLSDLEVTGLDIEPEVLELARRYADECGVDESRVHWVCADVHALPYPDGSFDLVVSRGSMPFWRDQEAAVREIRRVLRPGGVAFIGGGSGRLCPVEVWNSVRPGGDVGKEVGEVFDFPFPMGNMHALMTRAGICDYRAINEGGHWVEFHKPTAATTAEHIRG